MGSGLTYPLWFLGESIGLKAASILLPLILTVVLGLLIYWFARKWGESVALWSLFAFAVAWPAIFIGYSGMLDRDLLSVTLVAVGLFAVHRGKALVALPVALLLFWTWTWLGPVVLISLIVFYYAVLLIGRQPVKIPWKSLVVLTAFGVAVVMSFHQEMWELLKWTLSSNGVSESGHNPLYELSAYWSVLIPFGAGIAMGLKKRELGLLAWCIGCLIIGFVSQRLMIFMLPAVCVLCGLGMEFIWSKSRKVAWYAIVTAVVLGLLIGLRPPQNIVIPKDWVKACEYLKAETPDGSRILTAWDNGWWIVDVAERQPIVNNGTHSKEQDRRVFQVYCGTDEEAYQIANGWVSYIVFSSLEAHSWRTIVDRAEYHGAKEDTLYYRASREFESNYFEMVYRNDTVVILEVK